MNNKKSILCRRHLIIAIMWQRLNYLLADAGKNDQKRCVKRGEEDRDDNEGNIANDGGAVREGVQGGRSVIPKGIEPSFHRQLFFQSTFDVKFQTAVCKKNESFLNFMPLNKSEFEKVSSEHQAVEKETERNAIS